MKLTLPWPPSMNRYWRNVNGRTLLSKQGRDYRKLAVLAARYAKTRAGLPGFGQAPIRIDIQAFPPDKRRRDLDNLLKGVLDSMTYAGIYDDDSQISDLRIVRAGPLRGGKLIVFIEQLEVDYAKTLCPD